ncbi:hypothetical protein [Williamsia deligens]|uniref:Transcriptional regulator n=1 Tax=Williamsia deligens TaxID=321325 RepID=A0ABW3GGX6_9NOCA|nr:hypothetical protein [Williamsia deligens]MCP2195619.1 hypothetical protein [Williamsia deligens]
MAAVQNPWLRVYQKACLEDALNADLPAVWLRVFYLACGKAEANRHATFQPGEIAETLGISQSRVSDAIRDAKKYRHLDDDSCAACLVIPARKFGGGIGDPWKPCRVHQRKARAEVDRLIKSVQHGEILPEIPETVSG